MEAEVEGDFGVVLSADIGTVKHTFTMPWKDSILFNKNRREREYKRDKTDKREMEQTRRKFMNIIFRNFLLIL